MKQATIFQQLDRSTCLSHIPQQIRELPGQRFFPMHAGTKIPLCKGYQERRYAFNDPRFQLYLNFGANYSLFLDNLVVLDIDNPSFLARLPGELRQGFSVQTSRGVHLYRQGNFEGILSLEYRGVHVGELRGGKGVPIVGPGSLHPSGVRYAILQDAPITPWGEAKIEQAILSLTGGKPTAPKPKKSSQYQPGQYRSRDMELLQQQGITIADILEHFGVKVRGNKALCPFHADTIPSLSFTDELAFCHGCRRGFNLVTLIDALQEAQAEVLK